ncbi:hypothetical protein ACFWWM_26810 [Streptomyces sp. NPDC058682]|uniref:hypothetical protein n=1 Tax=Streptomyces sp. NPDC058682 TaxID=3346596 RepID=UPI003663E174
MNRLTAALTVAGSLPDVRFHVPLRKLLDDARAAYVIRSDGRALVRRLDPAVGAAVEEALKAADQPSAVLPAGTSVRRWISPTRFIRIR